ncbi:hypothetical protein CK203_031888 [Vitis vinifera]|uniref:Uncharacterized protein n=1 Tax=Vitis vinifera TaxID=29760 RepID=A0A438INC9_VITVI|nr:hypothetical protein CK203_031888 [Vitis vinifera]
MWSGRFLLMVMEKMGLGEVVKVDQVVFIHSQFFCFGQRNSFSCLLKRAVCGGLLLTYQVRGEIGRGCGLSPAVNLNKNELIPVGRVENVDDLASWDGIEERFRKRLAMWKWQYISKGGWGLRALLHSTRLSLENGRGALQMKERPLEPSYKKELWGGLRVSFWKDKWCGTSPLCVSFTSLFALAVAKEAWVSDLWTVSASGERRGVGTLVSIGISMIGSWMRWRTCWAFVWGKSDVG